MKEERYLRHDLTERLVHWAMAVAVILLIISGLFIRFPGSVPFFSSMNSARYIHFVSMYLLIFSWLFHIYHTLVVEFREEIVTWKDIGQIPAVIKYYLFLSDEHPLSGKYNALQKVTYNLLWLLIFIQVATGMVLYWPVKFATLAEMMGGIMAVRILHDFMTYVFVSFIMVHVYMILLEDVRSLWAMFHGYYYRKVEEK